MSLTTIAVIALIVLFFLSFGRTDRAKALREQYNINDEDPTDEDIRRVFEAGHKIYAIKLYRTKYDCGLKDAKEAVERLYGKR